MPNNEMRDQLSNMLRHMETEECGLDGDIICQNNTLQYYWSPLPWVDPRQALISRPEEWLNLGTDGWWSDLEQKELFIGLKNAAGELWPTHPGEWSRLDEVKTTRTYWIHRALRAEKKLKAAEKEIERLHPQCLGIPE